VKEEKDGGKAGVGKKHAVFLVVRGRSPPRTRRGENTVQFNFY